MNQPGSKENMELVHPEIETYAEEHTSRESSMIQHLVEHSDHDLEHIDMLSGPLVGRLLAMLIKISDTTHVLEIGTFTGYSALSMAEALPENGSLITCEYNKRYESLARSAFDQSDHGHKIDLIMGPALDTIDSLEDPFDFIFLDADKINYLNYYKKLLPRLNSSGLMVIDNVLWDGAVLAPDDEKSHAINKLNKLITKDERVEQVMLTVRDGVTIVRKL